MLTYLYIAGCHWAWRTEDFSALRAAEEDANTRSKAVVFMKPLKSVGFYLLKSVISLCQYQCLAIAALANTTVDFPLTTINTKCLLFLQNLVNFSKS